MIFVSSGRTRINDALMGGEIPCLTTVFLSEFPENFCKRFRKTSNNRTKAVLHVAAKEYGNKLFSVEKGIDQ